MITCINKVLCFVTLDCVVLLCGVVSYCNEDTIRSLRQSTKYDFSPLGCLGVCPAKENHPTKLREGLVKLNFPCSLIHAVEVMCSMMTINEIHKRV